MIDIFFYHLTTTPLERALPKLLEKALSGGWRALVVDANEERLEFLNQQLWTYEQGSFLPHGMVKDGAAEKHPVLLHNAIDNRNGARLLVVTDGRQLEGEAGFERVIDLIDGHDDGAVAAARARWKQYKEAGHGISYFKQTDAGGWEKAA